MRATPWPAAAITAAAASLGRSAELPPDKTPVPTSTIPATPRAARTASPCCHALVQRGPRHQRWPERIQRRVRLQRSSRRTRDRIQRTHRTERRPPHRPSRTRPLMGDGSSNHQPPPWSWACCDPSRPAFPGRSTASSARSAGPIKPARPATDIPPLGGRHQAAQLARPTVSVIQRPRPSWAQTTRSPRPVACGAWTVCLAALPAAARRCGSNVFPAADRKYPHQDDA